MMIDLARREDTAGRTDDRAIAPRSARRRAASAPTWDRPRIAPGAGAPGPEAPDARRVSLNDGVVAVCLLLLLAVAVLGGVLMLFSWVTAALPTQPAFTCPAPEGCVGPPDPGAGAGQDELRIEAPTATLEP
jgi:hypothetical protein